MRNMMSHDRMKDEFALLSERLKGLGGCQDNSCRIRVPGGMATNGGCRCDERKIRMALNCYRAFVVTIMGQQP